MSEIQLFVIGLAASVLVWIVKAVQSRGAKLSSGLLTGIVYAIAFGLALAFAPLTLPLLPQYSDPAQFVQAVIDYIGAAAVPVSAFVGFATLLYNSLLKRVLDGIGEKIFSQFLNTAG